MDSVKQFIEYLQAHGYPEASIAMEYRVGEKYRVDVAVLDLKNNLPIQLFEIKSRKSPGMIRMGIDQLNKYRSFLKNKDIPAYLVFPLEEDPFFEVLNIDTFAHSQVTEHEESKPSGLNYTAQRISRIAEAANAIKQEEVETVDTFKMTCWTVAVAVFAIGVVAKFKIINLSTTDMTILGVVIALILIPFASKLKILGVEFERLTGKKGSKDA